jgi:hypothetical protein
VVRARRIVSYISYIYYIFITPSTTHLLPIHITYIMPVQKRNEKGMTGYNALWDKQSAKDTADHVKSRVDNYTDLVNGMLYPSRVN